MEKISQLNKRTILFITPTFSKGGAEKNILNVANSLDQSFRVIVCVCQGDANYQRYLNPHVEILLLNKTSVLDSLPFIYKMIKRINPDVVFTSALHLSYVILLCQYIMRYRFINIVRVPSLPSNKLANNLKSKLVNFLARVLLKKASVVIAQSEQMKKEIEEYFRLPANQVIVIKNIVDMNAITRSKDEEVNMNTNNFNFVAAGSLYSAKGFDVLIKAFSEHIDEFPNTSLTIIGEESVERDYRGYLENLVSNLNLRGSVFLVGFQVNPYKYFNKSNVFVLSSIMEGFPNVVLENLALGKPVLVTNCVEYGDLINPRTGIIVEKGSVSALIDGLRRVRMLTPNDGIVSFFEYNIWFKQLIDEGTAHN